MSEDRDDDGRESRQDYTPPHQLGLDPAHADKFTLSDDAPFYVIDERGDRVQLVTDERGQIKRVPA